MRSWKTCSCGKTWSTSEEWRAETISIGRAQVDEDEWLEMRNCKCGSTTAEAEEE